MNNPYYQLPSPVGFPIIRLFDINLKEDCITTIEYLEDYGWRFNLTSVLKYLWRLGVKTEDIKSDCEKIIDYLDRELVSKREVVDRKILIMVKTEVTKLLVLDLN